MSSNIMRELLANKGGLENLEGPLEKPQGGPPDFPEGGGRAWAVAIGCGGLLFGTFGFCNAFGYVSSFDLHARFYVAGYA